MKIYANEYNLETPIQNNVWCPQHSDVAIGVKVLKNGETQEFTIRQERATEDLTPEDDKIAGYTIFKLQTNDPMIVRYNITCGTQILKLVVAVTATKVFEVNVGTGGGNPLLEIKLDTNEMLPYVGQDYVTEDDK